MTNPGGNYPGRQIFLGSINGEAAFAYFVSGRSEKSQQRYAQFIESENSVRIKPVDRSETFDTFRHYQAVRIDPTSGLLVVSNSQAPVEPIFEAFTHMANKEKYESNYIEQLLGVIGPEYDNPDNPTPRIMGVVAPILELDPEFDAESLTLAISTERGKAHEFPFEITPVDKLFWVATYNGDVNYRSFNVGKLNGYETVFNTDAKTPQELSDELYKTSDYVDPKYGELRVCTVAGVRNGNGPGGWDIAIRNRHNAE